MSNGCSFLTTTICLGVYLILVEDACSVRCVFKHPQNQPLVYAVNILSGPVFLWEIVHNRIATVVKTNTLKILVTKASDFVQGQQSMTTELLRPPISITSLESTVVWFSVTSQRYDTLGSLLGPI